MKDQRSPEANAYRSWYWTARWKRCRAEQLNAQPLCERCLKGKIIAAATVAHHKLRHEGDAALFWDGALESLCKPCHDGEAQREEHGRGPQVVDDDGWPVGVR